MWKSSKGPVPRSRLATLLLASALCACGNEQQASLESPFEAQRPEFLAIAAQVRESANEYLGGQSLIELQRMLESEALGEAARLKAEMDLCLEFLKQGRLPEAIAQVNQSIERVKQLSGSARASKSLLDLERLRGIVHLRDAERENCISRHNSECCIFPLEGGGKHSVREPAELALASFLAYLELQPDDLEVRWLANLAAQALGSAKGLLPESLIIDPAAMDKASTLKRFVEVGAQLGVDSFNLCGGSLIEDLNGDGWLDLVSSTYDLEGPMTLHQSQGDGRFTDRSDASRLSDQLGGLNCIGADYDNDGDVDILVLRGAWLLDQGQIRNSLLRNDAGVFTDVTRAAGLAEPARPTQAAVFADFNGDGHLDLYVANESRLELESPGAGRGDYPSQLFINRGDGTFEDRARSAGVTNDRYGKGVSAGDFDNDGDMDLYVSNVGPNRLYRNDGKGHFADVAEALGVSAPERSFSTWFFDANNDGWLDLFVAGYRTKLKHLAADYLGEPHKGSTPRLYLNDGAGGFRNITRAAGLDHAWLPMGANFGDVDGDGWLDIYLATGDPAFETLMPNVLLRNTGALSFQNETRAAGLGHLQKGHGVAFGDLDNDGDQDLFHQLGGFYPDDKYRNALFLNPGQGAHSTTIQLEGSRSNRAGIGARLKLVLDDGRGGTREIHRALGSVSSFGGSPARQEIGLGQATLIQRLEVFWPTSGEHQVFNNLPADQHLWIREFQLEPRVTAMKRFEIH